MNVSSKVPASCCGMSLPVYLASRFTYLSETAWRLLIEDGKISCNGSRCNVASLVKKGDLIRCEMPDFEAPTVNLDYSIVYEDEWLLGINKPAGLRVHSQGKFVNANLIYHLRHVHNPPYLEASLINRLDADTSGLVLLARNKTTLSLLMGQFSKGLVGKSYLAVVNGHPQPSRGVIDLPIGPVKEALVPRFKVDKALGKAAITHYETKAELSDQFSLLELSPKNGRTHQLRVHCASIGHPIAGDALYTMSDNDYLDWLRNPPQETSLRRQALHSHRLQFFHPELKTVCTLTAPLPPDIAKFIEKVTASGKSTA